MTLMTTFSLQILGLCRLVDRMWWLIHDDFNIPKKLRQCMHDDQLWFSFKTPSTDLYIPKILGYSLTVLGNYDADDHVVFCWSVACADVQMRRDVRDHGDSLSIWALLFSKPLFDAVAVASSYSLSLNFHEFKDSRNSGVFSNHSRKFYAGDHIYLQIPGLCRLVIVGWQRE